MTARGERARTDGAGRIGPGRAALPAPDQPLPEGDAKVAAVRNLFDTIAPRYDLVNRVMTFGMDRGWRRQTVQSLALVPGSVVVDLACGTGDLCRDLVRSGYRAVGVDLSFGMLACARTPSPLVQGDALRLPFPDASLSGVVSGFALRNFVELPPVFAELARVLRPGGRIALLDVARPERAILRAGHAVYFGRVVPVIGGLLSDKTAYRYLPRSLAYLPPPATVLAQLAAAGFQHAERRLLSGGITQLYTATATATAGATATATATDTPTDTATATDTAGATDSATATDIAAQAQTGESRS